MVEDEELGVVDDEDALGVVELVELVLGAVVEVLELLGIVLEVVVVALVSVELGVVL